MAMASLTDEGEVGTTEYVLVKEKFAPPSILEAIAEMVPSPLSATVTSTVLISGSLAIPGTVPLSEIV